MFSGPQLSSAYLCPRWCAPASNTNSEGWSIPPGLAWKGFPDTRRRTCRCPSSAVPYSGLPRLEVEGQPSSLNRGWVLPEAAQGRHNRLMIPPFWALSTQPPVPTCRRPHLLQSSRHLPPPRWCTHSARRGGECTGREERVSCWCGGLISPPIPGWVAPNWPAVLQRVPRRWCWPSWCSTFWFLRVEGGEEKFYYPTLLRVSPLYQIEPIFGIVFCPEFLDKVNVFPACPPFFLPRRKPINIRPYLCGPLFRKLPHRTLPLIPSLKQKFPQHGLIP